MALFKNRNGIEKNTLALLNVFYIYNQAKQVNYYSLALSYNLYIGIKKVWGFLPKYSIKKLAKHLFCDSMTALVRHSKAQKCLQINSKPVH